MKTSIKKTTKVLATLFVACGLIFSSCKKDPGPTGPTGPQGPTGATGNASVTSYTVSTTTANWGFTSPSWTTNVSFPQLTATIANGGIVAGYLLSGTSWLPLPKISYLSATLQSKYQFSFTTGSLDIYFTYSDYTTPPNPAAQTFRFVLVPPGMAKPNLNYDNFVEVKAAYNL